jgi:hypothetical protein
MTRLAGILLASLVLFSSKGQLTAKAKETVTRSGNIETVTITDEGRVTGRLIYTYEQDRKVRGEYWEAVDKKDGKGKSNILKGTPVATYYEGIYRESKLKDESGIQIEIEKDGLILKSVKVVTYNDRGLPAHVAFGDSPGIRCWGSLN